MVIPPCCLDEPSAREEEEEDKGCEGEFDWQDALPQQQTFPKAGEKQNKLDNTCPHVPGEAAASPESRLLE